MIPHNIQQKLEDRSFDCYQEALFDMSRKAHDHIYFRGASDLYFLLTEGAGEFDDLVSEEEFKGYMNASSAKSFREGAETVRQLMKPKMMAMEAEIQRLRAVMKDTASASPKDP